MTKQLANGMVSPFTGGKVYVVEDTETKDFRKETFTVHVRYYVCADTGEQFTTRDQDELLCNEVYNQYRVRHGIPFPDEIRSIRKRYGLTCSQITKIVGFGQNQWKQYEEGSVPSESNGRSIVAIRSREGMLSMLESCRNELDDATFGRLRAKVLCSEDETRTELPNLYFYGTSERGRDNGYSEMNPARLQSMVQYIVSKEKNGVTKTKLNKEMFFADFYSYRIHGRSISGLTYRALQFGPVPEHYETIYEHVDGVDRKNVALKDFDYDLLFCPTPDTSALSEEDIDVINKVMATLVGMSKSEVVELSHKEEGWLKHKDEHSIIPFEEAFSLKAFT
jgi:uncharacterized phage-associated protein/uncharacterized protein YbaR (Trm112 family)